MDTLRTLFENNRDLILFVYGMVFFTLGLMIALQSRRYSRLDLARSLKWLAAFGLIHGLHEWGDLFIPIQATYLNERSIQIWVILQLLLLSISFAFLFEFGVALLRPLGGIRWPHGISVGIWLLWAIVSFLILLQVSQEFVAWRNTANALARYFIGFLGGLLAAYGLRQQTIHRIAPLNVPYIVNTLRVAGIALFLYAIFGGLVPPPVEFFPGNIVNSVTFTQTFGLPPLVFRSLIGLVLALTMFRALEVFDVENARMIESMEQQQILNAERERIGRELHDGAIQTVYTAGLLVESASKLAEPGSQVAGRLEKAMAVLNDAIHDLRRNLGELRPNPCDESLTVALHDLTSNPRFQSMVDISLDLDIPDTEALSPVCTDHVIAIVGEALANVIRHARARQVDINARLIGGRLIVTVQDDGVGLPRKLEAGYGLRNMRDRARLLDGQLEVTGVNGNGTIVELDIPWKEER